MKIEIWSDIACPYCYIGKKKLQKALDQFPHRDKITLEYHCYELNPDLPKKALTKSFFEYFAESHQMTIEEAKENCEQIAELGRSVGLNFNFDKIVVANTSDALRLEKLAQVKGLSDRIGDIFFKAYFNDGEDVSDRSTLIRLGTQIGLSETDIVNILDSQTYLKEIEKDIEYSENGLNLEYIPFYLFNNKHIVQGSISVEDYLNVLTKSFAEWEKNGIANTDGKGDVINGQSCSIDGVCS